VVHEMFLGLLERGDWGLKVIGVLGSGCNEVLALEALNVIACIEWRRRVELPAPASASRAVAVAACNFRSCSSHTCVHVYMLRDGWKTAPDGYFVCL